MNCLGLYHRDCFPDHCRHCLSSSPLALWHVNPSPAPLFPHMVKHSNHWWWWSMNCLGICLAGEPIPSSFVSSRIWWSDWKSQPNSWRHATSLCVRKVDWLGQVFTTMSSLAPATIDTTKKCPSAADFLTKMQQMLQMAKTKIQRAAHRAKFYADKKRSFRTFNEGERVFLLIPSKSTSLSTGRCHKLSPRYCGS